MFPCSKCGCCCKRIDKAVFNVGIKADDNALFFPYTWDSTGRCKKLTKKNRCSVYDNRPLICNIDKLFELLDMPKNDYYKLNIDICNTLMDEDKVPLKYRIR
uniref:Putative zinc-or iron-chelating protein n=1 Tax=viral metagenome TaxID=1070528 RepID=A0A6M3M1G8_9ZZZZ